MAKKVTSKSTRRTSLKAKTSQTEMPLLPLKDLVVFPGCVAPLIVVREMSIAALEKAAESDKKIFLVAQLQAEVENPTSTDLHPVGTIAEILQVLKTQDGTYRALVEGISCAKLLSISKQDNLMTGVLEDLPPPEINELTPHEEMGYRRLIEQQFEQYAKLSERIPDELCSNIKNTADNVQFVNSIAHYGSFKTEQKQSILKAHKLQDRFQLLIEILILENDLLAVQSKIANQVRSQIGKSQREYFLNEQLKAIEQELGMDKEEDRELDELAIKIEDSLMPGEAKEKASRELQRLERMQAMSPEATVSRTYIEWLLDVPWGIIAQEKVSLEAAQKILDEDHFGLKKIKERIVEFLAVHQLTKDVKGPILCLVGPPGVGKTSLAQSVARALGRKFVRISLGGVRDEAEIRGHRRTYIGSMPGKIVQSLKKAGSLNPVVLLDEIDKMSSDFRGDPASAMLEVLDAEQNKSFNDHYLEVDLDLSKVMFITTANSQSGIPLPLFDRMEVLRIPGYTEDEKQEIAQRYLVPRQIKQNGLTGRSVSFTSTGIKSIIDLYTREAGVRNLEREIAGVCRKVAIDVVKLRAKRKGLRPFSIGPEVVREYLGVPKFQDSSLIDNKTEIGTAVGLAWTEVGGELLSTEVLTMQGQGALQLTGKLGDVMQESAKAALSWIRANAAELGIPPDFQKQTDIHIHCPEGAIPKDGPSAGITIATALISALSGRPARQDIAMTGEITLRGKVLKIGGLKEKALAAHRNHIRTILIPKDNMSDLEEITPEILRDLKIIPISTIHEGLAYTLGNTKKVRQNKQKIIK